MDYILSNHHFGYLASDCGIGHMWHHNARENKVNRWLNDSQATEGSERLELNSITEDFRFLLHLTEIPVPLLLALGLPSGQKNRRVRDKTTAFVPMDFSARVLIIEAENLQPILNLLLH